MAANKITIPVTLGGLEEIKRELADLKATASKSTDVGADKIAKEMKDLEAAIEGANKAFEEQVNVTGDLTKEYIKNDKGMIEVTKQISEMEDQMYSMILAGQGNTKEFENLRNRTAEFKQVVIETDKEIDLLAENRGLGAIGGGLGQIGERLMALDFQGAAKDAELLNKSMGSLGAMGKSSILGLVKTVGQLSKAFISFGVSLLVNPIFLIAAAVVAIVAGIAALLNKLGLLQPLLDAIGDYFAKIGELIEWLIDGFFKLTDAIGITDKAGEKMAQNEIDRLQKINDAVDKSTKKFVEARDEELKIAQINGEETLSIERRKQNAILSTARVVARNTEAQIKAGKAKGILDKEELEKLNEILATNKEIIKTSEQELRLIDAKQARQEREEEKREEEDRKKAAKERREREEKNRQDRLKAEREIIDLQLEALEEGINKEILLNEEKYSRLIEDTLANENLLQSEKEKLVDLLTREQQAKEQEIEDAFFEERLAAQMERDKIEAEAREKKLDDQRELQEKYDKQREEQEAKEEEQLKQRLARELEIRTAHQQAVFDIANMGITAIQGVADAAFAIQENRLTEGTAAEEQAAKRKFEINKKLQVAQAITQGIQATLAAFSSGSAVPGVGAVLGPAYAAAAAITAAANVAKIKAQTFEGGGGVSSANSVGAPNANISGSGTSVEQNTLNTQLYDAPGTTGDNQGKQNMSLNVTANVVASEVQTQNNINSQQEEFATL